MNRKKLSGQALVIQADREKLRIARMSLGTAMPQLQGSKTVETPAGAVEDGAILAPEALREALKGALAEPEFKKVKRVVFTLCSTQIISDTVRVPAVAERKLGKLLEANADMYFPVNMSEYHMVWTPVGKVQGEDREELEVRLWAVPNALVERYYALANGCGLSVAAIDYCGSSAAAMLDASYAAPAGRRKGLELGLGRKKAKEPENGGAAQAAEAVAEPQADSELCLLTGPEHLLLTFVREGQVKQQRLLLRGANGGELSEALMAAEYYRSQAENRGGTLGLRIGGTGADEAYIKKAEAAFGQRAERWTAQAGPEWILCLGASRARLDFGVADMDRPTGGREQLNQAWQYGLVLVGGALLAASLLVTFGSRTVWNSTITGLENQERALQLQAAQTQGNAQRYYEYEGKYDGYSSDWDVLFQALKTYNNNLPRMLEELESVLPKTTSVVTIGVAPNGLGLQFSCPNKEEAAYVIMALRELEYADLAAVSDITMLPGATAQNMLSVLTAQAQGEAALAGSSEAPPTKGSMNFADLLELLRESGATTYEDALAFAVSEGLVTREDLEEVISGLTPEEITALEAAYSPVPGTTYTLEELLARAAFDQRKSALTTMLVDDPMAELRFMLLVKADMKKPELEQILMPLILKDLMMNYDTFAPVLDGDLTAARAAMPVLAGILTQDETTLAATEKLIQTDPALAQRYAYYIEVALTLRAPDPSVGTLDVNKVIHDIVTGEISNSVDEETAQKLKEELAGAAGLSGSAIDEVLQAGGQLDEEARNELIRQVLEQYGIDPNNPGGIDRELYQQILSSILGGSGGNGSSGTGTGTGTGTTPNLPTTPQVPMGDKVYFAVALRYKQALLDEDPGRTGLTAADKVEKVEVEG